MEHLYKTYPPGLGHLRIPVDTRRATESGLTLYSPCRPRTKWLHRGVRTATRVLGARALPGPATRWEPPLPSEQWAWLCAFWRRWIGPFDDLAVYERTQVHRAGLGLLLLRDGRATAFVRMKRGDAEPLRKEYRVLESVAAFQPIGFRAPRPKLIGAVGDWSYLVTSTVAGPGHRSPANPPIRLLGREITRALSQVDLGSQGNRGWEPMHGDLTPWNLREIGDGSLSLIDWEDAAFGPPGADAVLYEATASTLESRAPRWTAPSETVDYWRERISSRSTGEGRDRVLVDGLVRRLGDMEGRPVGDANPVRGQRPRALVFAYACDPSSGSEPGAGWAIVAELAKRADCTVLVGPEHEEALGSWQGDRGGLRFETVPEPGWSGLAKRHRITWFLLYLWWLRGAERRARELMAETKFDVVLHATYSVYWLPTPAVRLGLPVIWGPVGGAVRTPLRLWPALGWRGGFDEVLDFVAVRAASCLPATRRTWRRVAVALVQNRSTLERLPRALRARSLEVNHVEFVGIDPLDAERGPTPKSEDPFVLFAGAIESRKGIALAIRAMSHVETEVRLVIAGAGGDRRRLAKLAARIGVGHRVEFVGRLPRDELQRVMRRASVGVMPMLRDEGGMVLGEAMRAGLPLVVLGHGGPLRVADSGLDARLVRVVAPNGVKRTARDIGEAVETFLAHPPERGPSSLDGKSGGRALDEALARALALRV